MSVHLESQYPVILSANWLFYFKNQYRAGTNVAQEHLRKDALTNSAMMHQELDTSISFWFARSHALLMAPLPSNSNNKS